MLVARNGKVLLQDAWGRADREAGTPNTLDTQFRIGSMNKMFTAVATLQLVEAGKLALDDPIGEHLPDYPNEDVASKVTVRHLLTHTGGTGDIFGPEFELNRLELCEELDDYVKLYGARALRHEPGARHEYSNYGFVLLGALIEKVSGESYYDYVRDNVFRPAGMTVHRLVARIRGRTEACGRIHEARVRRRLLDAEHDHAAVTRHLRGRRLLDRRRSHALRGGARVRVAPLKRI